MTTSGRRARPAAALVLIVLCLAAAAWSAEPVVRQAVTRLRTDADPGGLAASVVTLAAAAVLALIAVWTVVATTWCVVVALRTGATSAPPASHPLLVPWFVRLLVGAALGSTVATPAAAAPTGPDATTTAPRAARLVDRLPHALAGLPLPDRPLGEAAAPGHRETARTRAPHEAADPEPGTRATTPQRTDPGRPPRAQAHTVVPGDSLWRIAADRLPADAGAGVVDRGWRALYDENRARVGDAPDLIHPGTVLRLPDALAHPQARPPVPPPAHEPARPEEIR